MSKIFLLELELFKTPAVQSAVLKSSWADVLPTSLNLNSGALEFEIFGSDHYIDLEKTTLTLNVKVTSADGTDVPGTTDVALVNMPLHSLFQDVSVF